MEQRERDILAPRAAKSADSRGRLRPEPEDPIRPAFQRDRDRIIHSKAFRRLKHKTQVFFAPAGDHYRTRLTHTLEVSQIARSVSKVLRLNEELTEAIALGHDLGHTPFGHAGERVLNTLMAEHGGFEHNAQSLRIVEELEERYPNFRGLNLSWEVREGIVKHSPPYDKPLAANFDSGAAPALEPWARDLLTSTRLLLDSPAAADPRLGPLLGDLETVLVQIVQLPAARAAQERQIIAQSLDEGDLLTQLRTAVPAGLAEPQRSGE